MWSTVDNLSPLVIVRPGTDTMDDLVDHLRCFTFSGGVASQFECLHARFVVFLCFGINFCLRLFGQFFEGGPGLPKNCSNILVRDMYEPRCIVGTRRQSCAWMLASGCNDCTVWAGLVIIIRCICPFVSLVACCVWLYGLSVG
jgi:hypothetical protein